MKNKILLLTIIAAILTACGGASESSEPTPDVAAVRTRQFWNLIYDWTTVYGDQLSPSIKAKHLCRELLVMLDEEIGKAI